MANEAEVQVAPLKPEGVLVDLIFYMKNVIGPWVKARINAKSELGASLVEYALLVALIAVLCIAAVSFLGGKAKKSFNDTGSAMGD